jgi:hypothetical protein
MSGFYSNLLTKNVSMGTSSKSEASTQAPKSMEKGNVEPPRESAKSVKRERSLEPPVAQVEVQVEITKPKVDDTKQTQQTESSEQTTPNEDPSAKFSRRHDETAISDARSRYLARKAQQKQTNGS